MLSGVCNSTSGTCLCESCCNACGLRPGWSLSQFKSSYCFANKSWDTQAWAEARPPMGVPTVDTRGQVFTLPGSKSFNYEWGGALTGVSVLALGNLTMTPPRSRKGSGGGSHSLIPASTGSAAAGGKAEKVGITAALGLAGLSDALASPERSPEAAGRWVAEEAWCRCL